MLDTENIKFIGKELNISFQEVRSIHQSADTDYPVADYECYPLSLNIRSVKIRKQISYIPNNIGLLKNLEYLDLSDNWITKIENLEQLENLVTLNLGNNNIKKIENIANLSSLRCLELHGNQITQIENIDKLNGLFTLDLSSNRITKIQNLDNLLNLVRLYLRSNAISDIENLQSLITLRLLALSDNNISDIRHLQNLINLDYLDLHNNKISEVGSLKRLINLEKLDLSQNQITSIKGLEALTTLNTLYLENNRINDLSNDFPLLKWLKITNRDESFYEGIFLDNNPLKESLQFIEKENVDKKRQNISNNGKESSWGRLINKLLDTIELKIPFMGFATIDILKLRKFLKELKNEKKSS